MFEAVARIEARPDDYKTVCEDRAAVFHAAAAMLVVPDDVSFVLCHRALASA